MAKDGFLTAKAVANRIKSKGLQKLRWYCQICEKQCRDENGFKCHCASESHQRKILLVAESPEKYVNNYSNEFQGDFVKLLSTRYGARRVQANLVYQEFIADRQHLHMNATKWATLSEFVMHLGKEGLVVADETEKGWFITWVDRSAKTLARQEAIARKERMELDDEQREQRLIQQQIIKAEEQKRLQGKTGDGSDAEEEGTTELVRENEEEKIKLDISIKSTGLGTGLKLGGIGGGTAGGFKAKSLNALAAGTKKANPFKSAFSSSSAAAATSSLPSNGSTQHVGSSTSTFSSSLSSSSTLPKKRSAAEEIMEQELARKKRQAALSGDSRSSNNNNGSSNTQSRDAGRERNRDAPRERSSRWDQDRDGSKDRERDQGRDNNRDRSDYQSRESGRRGQDDSRDRERESYRDRDYRDRDHDRDRDRDSYRDRDSQRDRERERDRDRYKDRDDYRNRGRD